MSARAWLLVDTMVAKVKKVSSNNIISLARLRCLLSTIHSFVILLGDQIQNMLIAVVLQCKDLACLTQRKRVI